MNEVGSLVIDTLCHPARGPNIAVLSLCCDSKAQEVQSELKLTGSLFRLVATGAPSVPEKIKNAFEISKYKWVKTLRLPEMVKIFIKVINSIGQVFICIGAVHELLPQVRSLFVRVLWQIVAEAPSTRLFLTRRLCVRAEIDRNLTETAYIIPIIADQRDLARYASRSIDKDSGRNPELMTENLKDEIMKASLGKAPEIFLILALKVDVILSETSIDRRKEMLKKVATTGVELDRKGAKGLTIRTWDADTYVGIPQERLL
ncbi:hypothetical protein L873DRAFT_1788385 [Choiromyces venosus 120613-1]|uniref:Uncharacterized protein n=1 Tax=Choiromyces venosus 120613-1 TaxID=1336337 RepID=A0A3N4JWD9_9PEZI|nr:hypothetical protein L873DRAFT_1788385 [Choiromyces venosus 120613-1]